MRKQQYQKVLIMKVRFDIESKFRGSRLRSRVSFGFGLEGRLAVHPATKCTVFVFLLWRNYLSAGQKGRNERVTSCITRSELLFVQLLQADLIEACQHNYCANAGPHTGTADTCGVESVQESATSFRSSSSPSKNSNS